MTDRQGESGGVLRLRNLGMIENIRCAEDPAWRERLEQQHCRTMPRRSGKSCAARLCSGDLEPDEPGG